MAVTYIMLLKIDKESRLKALEEAAEVVDKLAYRKNDSRFESMTDEKRRSLYGGVYNQANDDAVKALEDLKDKADSHV